MNLTEMETINFRGFVREILTDSRGISVPAALRLVAFIGKTTFAFGAIKSDCRCRAFLSP
jgi:hypothetical protein